MNFGVIRKKIEARHANLHARTFCCLAYGQQAGGGQHGRGAGQHGGGQHLGAHLGAQQGSRSQHQLQLVKANAVAANATIELSFMILFFITTLLYLVCFGFRDKLFAPTHESRSKKDLSLLHTQRPLFSPEEF